MTVREHPLFEDVESWIHQEFLEHGFEYRPGGGDHADRGYLWILDRFGSEAYVELQDTALHGSVADLQERLREATGVARDVRLGKVKGVTIGSSVVAIEHGAS